MRHGSERHDVANDLYVSEEADGRFLTWEPRICELIPKKLSVEKWAGLNSKSNIPE